MQVNNAKVRNYSESSDMELELFVAELLQPSHSPPTSYKRDYHTPLLSVNIKIPNEGQSIQEWTK